MKTLKMKVLCFCTLLVLNLLTGSQSHAQPWKSLPSFTMMRTNGSIFKSTELKKDKPAVIIYFSPDCDHCHTLMNELFQHIDRFKNCYLLLVTFKPVNELTDFERSYQTAKYANIISGTEGTGFFLRYLFKIQKTPFTALYDKRGNLVTMYRDHTPVNELAERLHQLK